VRQLVFFALEDGVKLHPMLMSEYAYVRTRHCRGESLCANLFELLRTLEEIRQLLLGDLSSPEQKCLCIHVPPQSDSRSHELDGHARAHRSRPSPAWRSPSDAPPSDRLTTRREPTPQRRQRRRRRPMRLPWFHAARDLRTLWLELLKRRTMTSMWMSEQQQQQQQQQEQEQQQE
jgi:hypothetical protein